MKVYRIIFEARLRGSTGPRNLFNETIESVALDQAILSLYDSYECINIRLWELVSPSRV